MFQDKIRDNELLDMYSSACQYLFYDKLLCALYDNVIICQ